jgi:hypothetical protein
MRAMEMCDGDGWGRTGEMGWRQALELSRDGAGAGSSCNAR